MESSQSTASLQTLSMKLRADALGLPPKNAATFFPKALSASGSGLPGTLTSSSTAAGRAKQKGKPNASLPRLSASTETLLTGSMQPSINRNVSGTLTFGGVSGSSRVSGLYDDMAIDTFSHNFIERELVMHPSTLCVQCSKTASLCVDCCQSQEENSLYFYRNARAKGAIRFFEKGIIRAGQTNLCKFIAFRCWTNLTRKLKRLNVKFNMVADLEFRKTGTYIPFNAWKRFVRDQILTTKNQTIDDLITKKTQMEQYTSKLQTDMQGLGYQMKQVQSEAAKKGDLIVALEEKVKGLEHQLVMERQRNQHLCELTKSMFQYQQQLDTNFFSQMQTSKLDIESIQERLLKNLFIDIEERESLDAKGFSVDALAKMVTVNLNLNTNQLTAEGAYPSKTTAGDSSMGEEKEADHSGIKGGASNKAELTDSFLLTWAFQRASSLEHFSTSVDRTTVANSIGGPPLSVVEQLLVIEDAPTTAKPSTGKLAKGKKKQAKEEKKEKVEVFNFGTYFKQLISSELIPQTKVNVVDITFKPEESADSALNQPPPPPKSILASLKSGHVFTKLAISIILTHLKHYHTINKLILEEVKDSKLGDLFESLVEEISPDLAAADAAAAEESAKEGSDIELEHSVEGGADGSTTKPTTPSAVGMTPALPALLADVNIFGDYKPVELANVSDKMFNVIRSFVPLKSSELLKIKELYYSAVNSEAQANELMVRVIDLYTQYFNLPHLPVLDGAESKTAVICAEVSKGNESLIRWLLLSMLHQSVVSFDKFVPLVDLFHNYNVFTEVNVKAIRNISTKFCSIFDEESETAGAAGAAATAALVDPNAASAIEPLQQVVLSPLEKYNILGQKLDKFFSDIQGPIAQKTQTVCENVSLFSKQKNYVYEFLQNLLKTASFGNCDVNLLQVLNPPFL